MEKSKIHELIADKNAELERSVLRSASDVINQISKQQEVIHLAQQRIVELRKELHELELTKIDPKDILGE
jgi:hypothetical protein